tara:strand:- start:335 stop:514 length:180 start_codon:yes stop_codon:yes gene_type:complete
MGGFDNETSVDFSKNLKSHQYNFIKKRMQLNKEWKDLGLDKKMTFLQYCKQKKKYERKK